MKNYKTQYLIIGSGIIGLSIAKSLKEKSPDSDILMLEKESEVGTHASGRNSGVLHAGFYYTADSFKAKFAKEGNQRLTEYCKQKGLKINNAGKVVVATNEKDLETLFELKRRGDKNGVDISVVDEDELSSLEPAAMTHKNALYSPTTSTVDPKEIVKQLQIDLEKQGVRFLFNEGYYRNHGDNRIETSSNKIIIADRIINTAGLYADKVAKDFNFSKNCTIIPFKGIYLKNKAGELKIKKHIYPVPNIDNPFLGVHFTTSVDGAIKLGPTAIPAFWRENYKGFDNFKLGEMFNILGWEANLFLSNSFGFRNLAFTEMRKYYRNYFVNLAKPLLRADIELDSLIIKTEPGMRAQLLNTKTKELLQDFVIEGNKKSVHILNAVSPALTASFPFADYIVEKYIK
ncbi:L-2-hydroxyglutarate oxidase [Lentimicrobium sp. S6]|uniref:L-2-hydroxyglutarate oxidase n=1 Tax=Lentimicrobium sp. S6 TaxID=2735872 RepID=UPI0015578299|nr:L-2-hydroxyglutarate oxidase [Lentimicrobium sp. S6]NPD46749.1 L-2-hydroxyglutarate oxidase [Lentimicrobium sp. S6]